LNLDGVILLTATLLAITFTFLYKYAYQRSGSPITAIFITFLAVGTSTIHWLPRPHIFTFLILAIWIEQLDKLASGEITKKLYAFPIIMLFWANLHGGFIFGILVWIAYFAGWLWDISRGNTTHKAGKDLLLAGATSLVTTIITPDLWHNWEAVLNNRSMFILNRTIETMRPNLTEPSIFPYTLMLTITIIFFVINRRKVKPAHLFLLTGLGIMSILMARNIPLFVIACAPILSDMAGNYFSKFNSWAQINERFAGFSSISLRSTWPVTLILIAAVFFSFYYSNHNQSFFGFDQTVFPVEAVSYIQENHQQGNMFNEFNWGGYLLFKLFPRQMVFLDSQSDFYGERLIREYDQIMTAKGDWLSLLDKYEVTWAILPPNVPLTSTLQNELSWVIVYQDATATVIRKP
jgi:hypothetical protein